MITDKERTKKTIKNSKRPQVQFEVIKDPAATGRRVTFNVKRINFNNAQTGKHVFALSIAELVINSKEFRDRVRAKKSFTSSKMNGVQVYDRLMTGEETLQKGKDYEFDIHVTLYEENNSTVGYTYPNIIGFFVNNKFFKNYTPGEIAGNSVHEYLHKQGFGHTAEWTKERDQSVPYWIGYLVRDMVDSYIAGTLKLTDLYPATPAPTPKPEDPKPVPTPKPEPLPVPPVEVEWMKVCGWEKKWGSIPWYSCHWEKK